MTLHGLQYLRAFAALAVVYSHITIQVAAYQPYLPHWGSFGVDVFFVISGFIMVYIGKPDDSPSRFLAKRIRRVVPLYWFFTLLMAAILLLLPGVFKRSVFEWPALLQSLLFFPHYSSVQPDMIWPLVVPGWSLNYEMYFYLLFALSLLLRPRWRIAAITLVIVLVYLLAQNSDSSTALARFHADAIAFEFVFGMFIATAWQRGMRLPSWLAWLALAAGSLLLLLPISESLPRLWHFGLAGALLVAGMVSIELPRWRLPLLLGDTSYALYLSHLFVLGVLRVLLPPLLGTSALSAWCFAVLSLLATAAVSLAVHSWIDQGLLRIDFWRRPGFKAHRSNSIG